MNVSNSAAAQALPLHELEDALGRASRGDPARSAGSREVWRSLAPFARRHRRSLLLGVLAGALAAASQLATPWAAKTLLKYWLRPDQTSELVSALPPRLAPVLLGGLFAVLMVGLGYFDYVRRLQFARFSIGWSRDIRSAAFTALAAIPRRRRESGAAELVTRLIADVARFKAMVKVSLVYVVTNLILIAIASGVVFFHSPLIGAVFLGGMLAALLAAFAGARITRANYLHHRDFEGRLAHSIAHSMEGAETSPHTARMSRSSGSFESAEMKAEGLTTWLAHVIAGSTVLLAILIGAHEIERGALSPSVLLVFLAYAFLLSKPLVRLTRHAARMGKLLACGRRLQELLELRDLTRREDLGLLGDRLGIHVERLFPGAVGSVELTFTPGERVLLVGPPGAGKTALLELIAQRAGPARGDVTWDGRPLSAFTDESLDHSIGRVPQRVAWPRLALRDQLGLPDTALDERQRAVLRSVGLLDTVEGLPGALDCRLSSAQLSFGERRLVLLARALLRWQPLLLLDDPLSAFPEEQAASLLEEVLTTCSGTTVILASRTRALAAHFDRVLELKAGVVVGEPGSGR